jgi:hypothetical protein
MAGLSFFSGPETGLLSHGDTGQCPSSRDHLRPQSFDHEPEAGRQFEEPEAGIEPPKVHELGEVREMIKTMVHAAAHAETITPKAASPRGM